ncbi:MAG: hypothetical protein JSU61_05070 [Fidelibacterota bacterium]|nr:MAG: hypothetical protein JSU61_05070 [Candidatus Neomarinimicrobiota bacterium]
MGSFNKVFGIGLNRTGTSSLNVALNMLLVRTIHYPIDRTTYQELTTGQYDLTILEKFDGITDVTVVPYYRQLDRHYPGSKFILTLRDVDSWLVSLERWYTDPRRLKRFYRNNLKGAIRRFLRASTYGIYHFQEERMRDVYHQHHEAVRSYFAGREGNLLEMNIFEGDGWEKLCPFLGRPEPEEEFPNWQQDHQRYNRLHPRRDLHFD